MEIVRTSPCESYLRQFELNIQKLPFRSLIDATKRPNAYSEDKDKKLIKYLL